MKYDVTIPQWMEGKPLHIEVEAQAPDFAIDAALEKLKIVFASYNPSQEWIDTLRRVATVKGVAT